MAPPAGRRDNRDRHYGIDPDYDRSFPSRDGSPPTTANKSERVLFNPRKDPIPTVQNPASIGLGSQVKRGNGSVGQNGFGSRTNRGHNQAALDIRSTNYKKNINESNLQSAKAPRNQFPWSDRPLNSHDGGSWANTLPSRPKILLRKETAEESSLISGNATMGSTILEPQSDAGEESTSNIMCDTSDAYQSPDYSETVSVSSDNDRSSLKSSDNRNNDGYSKHRAMIGKLQEVYSILWQREKECNKRTKFMKQQLKETNNHSSFIRQLWGLCKLQQSLLETYHDFMFQAYCVGAKDPNNIGPALVGKYKIPLRLWTFGIFNFLEVLKLVMPAHTDNDLIDHFVILSFDVISCFLDRPFDRRAYWAEALGDLSRFSITLYHSNDISWKVSSEYWYCVASRTVFGAGRIYYHQALVSQDKMDSFVLLAKTVTARKPFELSSSLIYSFLTNSLIPKGSVPDSDTKDLSIEFMKIHRFICSTDINIDLQYDEFNIMIENLRNCFGPTRDELSASLSEDENVLVKNIEKYMTGQNRLKSKLSPLLHATNTFIINVTQLMSFGKVKENPFMTLFGLANNIMRSMEDDDTTDSVGTMDLDDKLQVSDKSDEKWLEAIDKINQGSVAIAFTTLSQYLSFPPPIGSQHLLLWLYFLKSLTVSLSIVPNARKLIDLFINKMFPWELLLDYLQKIRPLVPDFDIHNRQEEPSDPILHEEWKILGLNWMDLVYKGDDFEDWLDSFIQYDSFDVPINGEINICKKRDVRYRKILSLALELVEYEGFQICTTEDGNFGINSTYLTELENEIEHFATTQNVKMFFDSPIIASVIQSYEAQVTQIRNIYQISGIRDAFKTQPLSSENGFGPYINTNATVFIFDTQCLVNRCASIYRLIELGKIKCTIPVIVYSELRNLRTTRDARLSEMASRAVLIVKQLFHMKKVAILSPNGEIVEALDRVRGLHEPFRSTIRKTTEELVSSSVSRYQKSLKDLYSLKLREGRTLPYLSLDNIDKFNFCVFISDVKSMKTTAESLNIKCCDFNWFKTRFFSEV